MERYRDDLRHWVSLSSSREDLLLPLIGVEDTGNQLIPVRVFTDLKLSFSYSEH
jgi:hypothetical protein